MAGVDERDPDEAIGPADVSLDRFDAMSASFVPFW